MKKCVQNMDVKDKKVVLRVDYNVPIKNGVILDDSKIVESLDTINYLLSQNCKIIMLSHLGKVKSEANKLTLSLDIVAKRLKELLHCDVYFAKENFGMEVVKRVSLLKDQEILLLENTRFLDVPKKLESGCDSQVSEFWASLGDVFINDAFGSSHRRHASTYGISLYLPSGIGFLMQKEIKALDEYIMNPRKPFSIIMGGAKIDDKMDLLLQLIPKCDYVLCGGGIANTCLKALGFEVGESICSTNQEVLEKVKSLMLQYKEKFMLPLDVIVGNTYDRNYVKYKLIKDIDANDVIYDIGSKTIEKYKAPLLESQTVFLNGTVGYYEDVRFANGTKELLSILANLSSFVVVGGGDAASSVRSLGLQSKMTYISSGGGATLDYIVKKRLVALDSMEEEIEIETLDM